MLFKLDASLLEVLDHTYFRVALANLAQAHREGKHFLYGERTLLRTLSQHCDSEIGTSTLQQLAESSTQDKNLSDLNLHVCIVAPNNESTEEPNKSSREAMLKLSIKRFSDSFMTQAISLCIVDSDQKAPNAKYGATSKALFDTDNTKYPLAKTIRLEVREIENMLSVKHLTEVCNDQLFEQALMSLIQLEKENIKYRYYLDFKNGLKSDTLSRCSGEIQKYWLSSNTVDAAHNDDIILPGFGENVFRRTLDTLLELTVQKTAESLCEATKPEWLRIGKQVFAWCCCAKNKNRT